MKATKELAYNFIYAIIDLIASPNINSGGPNLLG